MPSPSSALATLRPDLGGSLEEFDLLANQEGFIGARVLPVIEVGIPAGAFGRIPIEQLLKNAEIKRTPRSGYARGDWKFEPDSFATQEYGFEEPVDRHDAAMYADYFDAEMVSAALARSTVLIEYEKRVAAAVFNATTFTAHTAAVGTEWSNPASTPISDIETAVRAVFTASGMWPNAMIINRIVFRNLRVNTSIIDRITASGAGTPAKASDVTAQMLAAVFDLDEIIVAGGAKNNAAEGQTAIPAHIWSPEYAMITRIGRTKSMKEPCLGRTIHWGGDGSVVTGAMESYYEEQVRADVIRCRHEVQEKMLHIESSYLLSNITA